MDYDTYSDRDDSNIMSPLSEIKLIDQTLFQLSDEMCRYIDEVKLMWDEHVSNFLRSNDCLTMQYLSLDDSQKFIDMMTNQKTYKIMMISKKRLEARKTYLMKCNKNLMENEKNKYSCTSVSNKHFFNLLKDKKTKNKF